MTDWITKVADQRIAVWWAGRQSSLHPDLLRKVKSKLTRNKEKAIVEPVLEGWNAIFELSYFYSRDEFQDYDLKDRIQLSGWSNFFVREYTKISAPFLKKGSLHSLSIIPRDNRKKLNKHPLVHVEVDYPTYIYDINVPDEYLPQVVNALRINLERAVDMEQYFSDGLQDICAIEPDDDVDGNDTSRGYKLSGYVLHFTKLFRKLHNFNVDQARCEFSKWRRDDRVFTRLRIWVCGLKDLIDEAEFMNEILSPLGDDSWPLKGERDLLLALKKRWNELSEDNRKLIEKRILKGSSKPRKLAKEKHTIRSAHNQLNRLHWLNIQGCELCLDLDAVTKKLRVKAPNWQPEYAEKAAESNDSRARSIIMDTDWSNLNNVPLADIIPSVKKKKRKSYYGRTEHAPFEGLCDDLPLKAIAALSIELKKGNFHADFWTTYLARATRQKDKYRQKLLTAGRITQISDKNFNDIFLIASRWFEDHGPELREKNLPMFEAVWGKFIQTISKHQNSSDSALVRQKEQEIDWTGEAFNSASGNLAALHMTFYM